MKEKLQLMPQEYKHPVGTLCLVHFALLHLTDIAFSINSKLVTM